MFELHKSRKQSNIAARNMILTVCMWARVKLFTV